MHGVVASGPSVDPALGNGSDDVHSTQEHYLEHCTPCIWGQVLCRRHEVASGVVEDKGGQLPSGRYDVVDRGVHLVRISDIHSEVENLCVLHFRLNALHRLL